MAARDRLEECFAAVAKSQMKYPFYSTCSKDLNLRTIRCHVMVMYRCDLQIRDPNGR